MNDLHPIYEMPTEAVQWVDEMIRVNAFGGKMNRGLAVMDVRKIFAAAQGKNLSNAVPLKTEFNYLGSFVLTQTRFKLSGKNAVCSVGLVCRIFASFFPRR